MCRSNQRMGYEFVPLETEYPYDGSRLYWNGFHAPTSTLQVEGNKEGKRILDSKGNPVKRQVHRVGFQNSMVIE